MRISLPVGLLFASAARITALRSGDWVPLADEVGSLSCPQSKTTQQGIGHCIGITPLGAAIVGGTGAASRGADLFVQCKAQSTTWGQPPAFVPQGGTFTYRYLFLRFDNATGAPVFAAQPIILPPWNAALPLLAPSAVWQGVNRTARAAAFTSDYMHLLQLAANGSVWQHLHSWKFSAPAPAHSGHWQLVVPKPAFRSRAAAAAGAGAGWTIFGVRSSGTSARAKSEFTGHSNWRSTDYEPYAGDGIYRGTLSLTTIHAFDMSATGEASNWRNVTPTGWSGGLLGLNLGWRAAETDASGTVTSSGVLLAASRTGLVFEINAKDAGAAISAGLLPPPPRPLSDATTGVLFNARVIGAAPLVYGADGLIVGGEASLHYARISTGRDVDSSSSRRRRSRRRRSRTTSKSSMSSLRSSSSPELLLHHVGPVLQQSAVLLTGQTPTVSIADWNGDGVNDIIAGSSEGRIFFVAGVRANVTMSAGAAEGGGSGGGGATSGGLRFSRGSLSFARPVPLHTGEEGTTAVEILVQGGYRIDIQGPQESRWGYTAVVACDWNEDGLMDLISSDNSALTKLYVRYRTAAGTLALRAAVALKLDGLELHGTWRNGPACGRIGSDPATSRIALVTSDADDEAHLYYRIDDANVEDGGKLLVQTNKEERQQYANVQTNYLHAGGSGRLKYAFADFDRDGRLDLLLGTSGYHSVPNNGTGFPACSPLPPSGSSSSLSSSSSSSSPPACRNNGATALVMLQSAEPHAVTGQLVFEMPKWITFNGYRASFGGQELGIAPIDVDRDGKVSIILATPGGRHLFFHADALNISAVEPPLQ